jgi:predicted nuclease with TOPRIM domain
MKELNDNVQHLENESKDTREKFAAYRDEMTDTEVRIESLALDLEMAEEKVFLFFFFLNHNSSFCLARNYNIRKYNIKRKI